MDGTATALVDDVSVRRCPGDMKNAMSSSSSIALLRFLVFVVDLALFVFPFFMALKEEEKRYEETHNFAFLSSRCARENKGFCVSEGEYTAREKTDFLADAVFLFVCFSEANIRHLRPCI